MFSGSTCLSRFDAALVCLALVLASHSPAAQPGDGPHKPIPAKDHRARPDAAEELPVTGKGSGHHAAGEVTYRDLREKLRRLLETKLRSSGTRHPCAPGYEARTIRGWTVLVSRQLMKDDEEATERALDLLERQLEHIIRNVPAPVVEYLRTVPLWFSPVYPAARPTAEYHPDPEWLRHHGRPLALTQCIEFTNIDIFERETRRMPVFAFHELAHAYHDQVLGFDNPQVQAAYRHALEQKLYEHVLRRHGDGRSTVERAYAMDNAREYFAETSEAMFGQNDFYPFTREELREHDPTMYRLLEELWLCHPAPCRPRDKSPTKGHP